MQLILHEREVALEYAFATAHGSKTSARALIVELREGEVRGFGEAAENQYFRATVRAAAAALNAERDRIEAMSLRSVGDVEAMYEAMRPRLCDHGFALAALDEAAWDLCGKLRGEATWRMMGLESAQGVASSYTIGLDSIDGMRRKIAAHADWPVYKIKLDAGRAVDVVRALREVTDKPFRVDANCAWEAAAAVDIIAALAELGVELIEQPLAAGEIDATAKLREHAAAPIVADESCVIESDVARCDGAFDGVNVKLTKCGGLTPALRMLREAKRRGMATMLGCMTETTVGISAAGQLISLLDFADLDGAALLAEDVADGVRVEKGRVIVGDEPGQGVRLRQA